jgi:hypothetical protein
MLVERAKIFDKKCKLIAKLKKDLCSGVRASVVPSRMYTVWDISQVKSH